MTHMNTAEIELYYETLSEAAELVGGQTTITLDDLVETVAYILGWTDQPDAVTEICHEAANRSLIKTMEEEAQSHGRIGLLRKHGITGIF